MNSDESLTKAEKEITPPVDRSPLTLLNTAIRQNCNEADNAIADIIKAVKRQIPEMAQIGKAADTGFRLVVDASDETLRDIDRGDIKLTTDKMGNTFAQMRQSNGRYGEKLPIKREEFSQGIDPVQAANAMQVKALQEQLDEIAEQITVIDGRVKEVLRGQQNDRIGLFHSGMSLYPSFEQLWRDLNNFDLTAAGTGREVLWVFPYGNNRGRWNYTFAVRHDGADQFIGATAGTSSRGGSVGPVPTMWFEYEKQDTRRDVSCVNYIWEYTSPSSTTTAPVLAGLDTWYFGKYRFEWMENYPYSGGNDDGFKPPYMRLSDVYLMAAECAIHSSCASVDGGGLDNAKNYLLQVRKRAYAGNEAMAQSYVDAIGSADAMFDAIVDERALEFVGEMLRKTDLIRWNLLKTKMDETKQKLNDLNNWTGDFSYLAQGDGYVYYKVEGTKLEMYGLGRDEQTAPDATWIPYTNTEGEVSRYAPCASDTESPKFTTAEINRLYDRDPDTRQYWPIFQSVVDNSQGQIHNDYGY